MAVIRVEKTKDYTVMSNHHLRDTNLSLKAKGLLSLMLSLPNTWSYTLAGLSKICKEGVDSIRTGVKELEQQGYIERRRVRNEKGQWSDAEYIIRERPVTPQVDVDETEDEQEATEPVSNEPTYEEPTQNNPTYDEPMWENPTQDNPTQLNKDITNKDLLNKDCIKYLSINHREQLKDGWIDEYNHNIELVKRNIGYDALVYSYDQSVIDEMVAVMAEVLTVDTPYYTIERKQYPTELVRQRFREIDYGKLDAFLLEFTRRNDKIRNVKAYLISALFNAPATADINLANMVRSDMCVENV